MSVNGISIPVYNSGVYNSIKTADLPANNNTIGQNQTAPLAVYPSNYYTNINVSNDWVLNEITKTPLGDNIYKYTLKNGQIVALVPKKDATTVIKTFVNAGSMNENDSNRGISHFNEHNVFNGSKNLEAGKFFTETGKLGADTNASTDFAKTDFYISSPLVNKASLQKIIEMHADMLVNPLFPEDMIQKEKGPVTSEISMCNDNSSNRALNDVIKNLFQIESSSDDLVAGSIETVNNITRDDVYNHWKKHFTPDNMYTVMIGDFNPNEVIETLSKNFTTPAIKNADAARTKQKLTPIEKSVRTDFISNKDTCTKVFCAFSGPKPDNLKDFIALDALERLLFDGNNSRLKGTFDNMYADEAYSKQKVGLQKDDPEAIIYQFSAQKGDENKVLDKFYEGVKFLETTPPTSEEMQIIKNAMLEASSFCFEESESTADLIGDSLLGGYFSQIGNYKTMIENLTADDLVYAAKKYLDFNKISVAIVHPNGTTQKEIQENYKNSSNSFYAYNNPQNINFTGKRDSTDSVRQSILPDNSMLTVNNSNSENSYIDWRLTCKEVIPENPACPYVLEQILNDGTKYKSKSQLSKEASLNSVDFDVSVNSFQIHAGAVCLWQNTNDAINVIKQALYQPRFSEEDFNAAKNKIKTYCLNMDKDASTNLLAKLYGKYFPSPKQIIEGLETLTLDDVKNMYNNLIYNSSSNFVITAPIEKHPELNAKLPSNVNTSGLKFQPYAPKLMQSYVPNEKEVVLLDTQERNQAQIYKNYSFEISGNITDEIKFELLNTILGGSPSSRLFQDLREKQKLAYTVSSQIQSFENSGILTLRILSTTDDKEQNDIKYDNLQKCLEGFQMETDRLKNEEVTDEELEAAKTKLKQDIASQLELSSTSTALLSMNLTQPYGIKRIDEYIKTIDKITKEDIKQAANHIFENKPVYSILASEDTVNNQMDYINSLGEVIKI